MHFHSHHHRHRAVVVVVVVVSAVVQVPEDNRHLKEIDHIITLDFAICIYIDIMSTLTSFHLTLHFLFDIDINMKQRQDIESDFNNEIEKYRIKKRYACDRMPGSEFDTVIRFYRLKEENEERIEHRHVYLCMTEAPLWIFFDDIYNEYLEKTYLMLRGKYKDQLQGTWDISGTWSDI